MHRLSGWRQVRRKLCRLLRQLLWSQTRVISMILNAPKRLSLQRAAFDIVALPKALSKQSRFLLSVCLVQLTHLRIIRIEILKFRAKITERLLINPPGRNATGMKVPGNFFEKILLWILTVFFAVFALMHFPSLHCITAVITAALLAPIPHWQETLSKFAKGNVKTIITIILVILTFLNLPAPETNNSTIPLTTVTTQNQATEATSTTLTGTTEPTTAESTAAPSTESDTAATTEVTITTTVSPTTAPSTEPVTKPTTAPTTEPTTQPTTVPTTTPTTAPTTEPATQVTTAPTTTPTTTPTTEPATQATTAPTTTPTTAPITEPATQATTATTAAPTTVPPTEPSTAPPTEPPTEPATTAATAPPSDPTEPPTTQPPTEPATEATAPPSESTPQDYVLNKNSKKFHYPSCSSAKQIKDSNREDFYGTRDELLAMNYSPCGRCHP